MLCMIGDSFVIRESVSELMRRVEKRSLQQIKRNTREMREKVWTHRRTAQWVEPQWSLACRLCSAHPDWWLRDLGLQFFILKLLVFLCVTSIELGIIVVIVHIFTISSSRYSRIITVFILASVPLRLGSTELSKQICDNSLCKCSQVMHLKNHQLLVLARPLLA